MSASPEAFSRFAEKVRQLFAEQEAEKERRTLILAPNQMDVAVRAEKTTEFDSLAVDLFRSQHTASRILRRSGFYGRAKAGQSDEELWSHFETYTKPRQTKWATLMLLDGCWFPLKSFELLGHTVNAMTKEEARNFEPPQDFLWSYERVPEEFTDGRWSLVRERDDEVKPGHIRFPHFNAPLVAWSPLFCLALYNPSPFYVTKAFAGEPGYELYRVRDDQSHFDLTSSGDSDEDPVEVPARYYQIAREEWEKFERYLHFYEAALGHIQSWDTKGQDKNRRFIRLAGRRYLRATFSSDPNMDAYHQEDREDMLLQYMFGLEGLLVPERGDSINYRVATRGAVIAGGDDAERQEITKFLKQVYGARSQLAHGSEPKKPWDLPRLREIYRVVALVILELSQSRGPDDLID
jgi:hypothetical protein